MQFIQIVASAALRLGYFVLYLELLDRFSRNVREDTSVTETSSEGCIMLTVI